MRALLPVGIVAAFVTGAFAAPLDLMVSKNKRTVSVSLGAASYTVPLAPPNGLSLVFSNIGKKYPDGVYFSCDGLTIAGPDSIEGQTVW